MEDPHQVSDDNNVQISKSSDHRKLSNENTPTGNVVIDLELNDDERDNDTDCIFVKHEKILMPRIPNKPEKKVGKEIDSDLVQCVDDYDDDNDEIRIVSVKPPSTPETICS